jgi:hypothetical protein
VGAGRAVRDRIDLAVRPWKAALFHRGGARPDALFAVLAWLDGLAGAVLADLRWPGTGFLRSGR